MQECQSVRLTDNLCKDWEMLGEQQWMVERGVKGASQKNYIRV